MDILSCVRDILHGYPAIDLESPVVMRRNLAFMMQMIVTSETLLRVSISRLEPSLDIFDMDLRAYYAQHLEEETGHYEWMQADMEGEKYAFHWGAAELAGMQYYLVQHVHPAALLGYMLVLECLPMSMALIEHLESIHGEKLLRTLRYHAVHDQDHSRDLLAMVWGAPEQVQTWIYENAIQTAHRLGRAQEQLGE
jgi:hypothetical protein